MSRANHGKLLDVAGLQETLQRWDTYTPFDESDLAIDNSELSASKVADLIQQHYGL